jgi:hypothetical protein
MKDNLRDAAQAAYRAMIAAELSDGSRKEWEAAVDGLKAALAEPVVKESLTTQPSTPRTDAEFSDDYYTSGFVRTEFAQQLERELAAAIADAERYRWLADKVIAPNYDGTFTIKHCKGANKITGLSIDAAIDAAMKECGK